MEVSSPGRICLFGEHQDYLGLPVIAMAMNLRLQIRGRKRNDKKIIINLPNIDNSESFFINDSINIKPKNIFQSGVKVCIEEGLSFSSGFEVEILSKIPIQAGAGSSSALMVAWINFLSQVADNHHNLNKNIHTATLKFLIKLKIHKNIIHNRKCLVNNNINLQIFIIKSCLV